jgi:hypothetical protein
VVADVAGVGDVLHAQAVIWTKSEFLRKALYRSPKSDFLTFFGHIFAEKMAIFT